MTDDLPTSPFTSFSDLGLTQEEKRTIAMLLIGVVTAFVLAECVHRLERRLARRHPFLTEIVEGASSRAPGRR